MLTQRIIPREEPNLAAWRKIMQLLNNIQYLYYKVSLARGRCCRRRKRKTSQTFYIVTYRIVSIICMDSTNNSSQHKTLPHIQYSTLVAEISVVLSKSWRVSPPAPLSQYLTYTRQRSTDIWILRDRGGCRTTSLRNS